MRIVKRLTTKVLILSIALPLCSSSCVQLKEIQAFAALSGDVGTRFPSLARDLYDSCLSQQRLIVAQKEDFRVDKFADLNDSANPLMAEGVKVCKVYADEQDRLIKANGTLVSYLKSLGDLAADDVTNFDKSIQGFATAVTTAKLLADDEASAITKLAGFLAHIATERYRRKQLREAIKTANPQIQLITQGLGRIIAQNYLLQLENERVAMRDYYRKLVRENVAYSQALVQGVANGAGLTNPAPLDDLKTKFEAKNAALNIKINGAKAYLEILKTVAAGHQKLNDSVDKLDSRQLLSEALSYAKTIESLATDFRKAF